MGEHKRERAAIDLAELDGWVHRLQVDGTSPNRDKHRVGRQDAHLNPLHERRRSVDENPVPACRLEHLNVGLGVLHVREQFGVGLLGLRNHVFAPELAPARQGLLRIKIEQRDPIGLAARVARTARLASVVVLPLPPLLDTTAIALPVTILLSYLWH